MFHNLSKLIPRLLKSKNISAPVYAARVISKYQITLAKLGLEPFINTTRAFKVSTKTLWIKVPNNIYAQELSLKKNDIISGINEELGTKEIEDIRFNVTSLIKDHDETQGY